MAAKPVDRIRSMITELERGARTLGDDIRKRAGSVVATNELEAALRQFMKGLTNIAAQLEKAAGELRRYLESNTKAARPKASRKAPARKAKARPKAKKKAAAKAPAKAVGKAPKKKAR